MAVYVDAVQSAAPYRSASWRYKQFCHMFSDNLDELHVMADKIGLKRSWFQPHVRDWMAHYDLTPSKRQQALKQGALEISGRDWAKQHLGGE